MKKVMPVIIALVLIILIGLGFVGVKLYEKYSYSKEIADLEEYFGNEETDEVSIIFQNERLDVKAKIINGVYYFEWNTVKEHFNDRFYVSTNENVLLYTTPTDIIKSEIGSNSYDVSGGVQELDYTISTYVRDVLYVACDYVQLYTNFNYITYSEPNYMQVDTIWDVQTIADVKKNTQVRYQGGIKSEILQELKTSDQVVILEELEDWTKVKSATSMIGYVPKKSLTNIREEQKPIVVNYEEPVYTSLAKDTTINLAWHQVTNLTASGSSYLIDMLEGTKGINTLSPTWFFLNDNEGNFESIATHEYVATAHERGIEVWALIEDIRYHDNVDMKEVLSYAHKRENLINNLINEVNEYDIDGINIDFEYIAEEAGEDFIQFIRELSIACRSNEIVLSIDNYVPREHTSHYNRKEQGVVADYVVIMGYDEHYAGSPEAGSVASIGFVEDGIARTLEAVPANKIINGVPFYTRIWSTTNGELSAKSLPMNTALEVMAEYGAEPTWNEETGQYYSEIEVEGTLYQCWFEEENSLKIKLDVMKNYDIGGVAGWKLGLERPQIWDVMEDYTVAE